MKIKIFNDTKQYTLTSTLKVDDIKLVQKYRPKALKKKDADGNDIFAMSYVEGRPCVAAHGITFGAKSHEGGYAMIVAALPEVEAGVNVKERIADIVGSDLTYINELEASIPTVVEAIRSERAAIINSVTEV